MATRTKQHALRRGESRRCSWHSSCAPSTKSQAIGLVLPDGNVRIGTSGAEGDFASGPPG